MINKINEYLDETLKTKKRLNKKIIKLEEENKKINNNLATTTERADKWKNTSRELNKELEELKSKYSELKLGSMDIINKLERKVTRLQKKVDKYEQKPKR